MTLHAPCDSNARSADIRLFIEQAARLWVLQNPGSQFRDLCEDFTEAAAVALWYAHPEARTGETGEPPTGFVVYRAFDANDDLLYVGSSGDVRRRMRAHARGSDWWSFVSRIETAVYDSSSEMADAEALAIKTENPIWNVVGIRGGKA